jgi:hypothetical protein
VLFYHGGRPGLGVGDAIRPPAETGLRTFTQVIKERAPWLYEETGRSGDLQDRVYVASILNVPLIAASFWTLTPWLDGDGWVYLVRPIGELEPDLGGDHAIDQGASWTCDHAIVRGLMYTVPREWVMAFVPGAHKTAALLNDLHAGRRIEPTAAQEQRLRARQRQLAEGRPGGPA